MGVAVVPTGLRLEGFAFGDNAVTRTRIQADYVVLRGQLVFMLLLAMAIALRSMFFVVGESPRGHFDTPGTNEAQQGAARWEWPSSGGLRYIDTESGPVLDDSSRGSRMIKEMQE